VIAESTAIRNHVGMTDDQPKPTLRWYEGVWMSYIVSFFLCTGVTGLWMFLHYTLDDSAVQRIGAAFFAALFFGGPVFVIYVLPAQVILHFALRWFKLLPCWKTFVISLPGLTVFVIQSQRLLYSSSFEHERSHLEQSVGGSIPPEAKLILAQHGFGLADRRHLWLIEGTPDDFDRFIAERGWMAGGERDLNCITEHIRNRIKKHFVADPPWKPDLIFRWGNVVEPVPGPLGNSCLQCLLLADKERKRWVVYVID
jgi:hypothetical protein